MKIARHQTDINWSSFDQFVPLVPVHCQNGNMDVNFWSLYCSSSKLQKLVTDAKAAIEDIFILLPDFGFKECKTAFEVLFQGHAEVETDTTCLEAIKLLNTLGISSLSWSDIQTHDQEDFEEDSNEQPDPSSLTDHGKVSEIATEYLIKKSQMRRRQSSAYRCGRKMLDAPSKEEVRTALHKAGGSFFNELGQSMTCGLCLKRVKLPSDRTILGLIKYFEATHLNQCHKSGKLIKKARTALTFLYTCRICDKTFNSGHDLTLHFNLHHQSSDPFYCEDCDHYFEHLDVALNHFITQHDGQEVKKCHQCPKLFQSASDYLKHFRRFHGTTPYQCYRCSKTFKTLTKMKTHLSTHIKDSTRSYPCPECGKSFQRRDNLNRHFVRQHQAAARLQGGFLLCSICSKPFSSRSFLLDHLQTHRKDPSYLCSRCGKSFYTKDSLAQHVRNVHPKGI